MPRPARRNRPLGPQPVLKRGGLKAQAKISPRQKQTLDQNNQRLAKKPLGKRLDDSDDSDLLVIKGAGGRKGNFLPVQEAYASGAVAGADKPNAHPTRTERLTRLAQAAKSTLTPKAPAFKATEQPQVNGVATKDKRSSLAQAGSLPKQNGAALPTQPTPSRDASILDGFKPRKRQASILQAAQLDSSTLDLSNDSFALPDDESTPVQIAKARTLARNSLAPPETASASRKRKLSPLQPVLPVASPTMPTQTPTSRLSLPPQSLASLRASGQKQRLHYHEKENDETDIMAPPMSSSPSASPEEQQPSSSRKPKSSQRIHNPTTAELQALMPNKRRKTTTYRTPNDDFEIPADIPDPADDDTSFIPSNRRGRKRATNSKPTTKLTTKSKSKVKARATPAAKQPLQQSSSSQTNKNKNSKSFLGPRPSPDPWSSNRGRRSGGSRLKPSSDTITIKGPAKGLEEKENEDTAKDDVSLPSVGNDVEKEAGTKKRSKWDDIDAFEMDFEDVSVYDGSSEINAR